MEQVGKIGEKMTLLSRKGLQKIAGGRREEAHPRKRNNMRMTLTGSKILRSLQDRYARYETSSGGVAPLNHRLLSDVAVDVVKSDWLFHVVLSREALRTRGRRT